MHGVLRTNNLPGGPDGTRWPSQRAQSTVRLSEAFLLYLSGLVFSPSSGYFCHRPSCLLSFDHLKSKVRLPPNLLRVSEFLNQLSPHSLNLAFCTFSSLSSLFFVKKDEKKTFFRNLRGAERFAGLQQRPFPAAFEVSPGRPQTCIFRQAAVNAELFFSWINVMYQGLAAGKSVGLLLCAAAPSEVSASTFEFLKRSCFTCHGC